MPGEPCNLSSFGEWTYDLQCKASFFWSFECFLLPNGSKRHLFTISSCQMQGSAATDGLALGTAGITFQKFPQQLDLTFGFTNPENHWRWPWNFRGLKINNLYFNPKFTSFVNFQERIILHVSPRNEPYWSISVKESFRSRLRPTIFGPLEILWLISRVKFSVWPVFLWSPNFETDPHPQVFKFWW